MSITELQFENLFSEMTAPDEGDVAVLMEKSALLAQRSDALRTQISREIADGTQLLTSVVLKKHQDELETLARLTRETKASLDGALIRIGRTHPWYRQTVEYVGRDEKIEGTNNRGTLDVVEPESNLNVPETKKRPDNGDMVVMLHDWRNRQTGAYRMFDPDEWALPEG